MHRYILWPPLRQDTHQRILHYLLLHHHKGYALSASSVSIDCLQVSDESDF